jgi:hypothetical protein
MKRTIVTIAAATLALFGAGATVAAPPAEAAAAGKVLAYGFYDPWFGGTVVPIVATVDEGDCDYDGYKKEIFLGGHKRNISSIAGVSRSSCNTIRVYRMLFSGVRGPECYVGTLPFYNMAGHPCDNAVHTITVWNEPWRSNNR